MFSLECPNCRHEFCMSCAKLNNDKPLGVGSYDMGSGFRIEKILECHACETPNYQKFWKELRVVAKRNRHEANQQLDLFRERQ
jgi:hypothetical protein